MVDHKRAAKYLAEFNGTCLPMRHISQPATQLCWATCYQMVDQRTNGRKPICHYVNLQSGSCDVCNVPSDACNRPRYPRHVLEDWKSLGYDNTAHHSSSLSIGTIRNDVSAGVPIQAYLNFRDRTAHYILVIGTTRTPDQLDTALVIADPLSHYIEMMEFSELVQWADWQQSWRIKL